MLVTAAGTSAPVAIAENAMPAKRIVFQGRLTQFACD